jgi:hypothetical protein
MKARKLPNTIYLRVDPSTENLTNDWNLNLNKKSFGFQKWDINVINSPKEHQVINCELDLVINNKEEIDNLIKFLENLKQVLIDEK